MYKITLHKMHNDNDEFEKFEKLEDAFYVFMQLYNKYIDESAYVFELKNNGNLELSDLFDNDLAEKKITELAKKHSMLWSAIKLKSGLRGFIFETEEGLKVISVTGDIYPMEGWLSLKTLPIELPIIAGGLGYNYKIILEKI